MNDVRLTEKLVPQILGWRSALGRFLALGQSWIPMSPFKPPVRIETTTALVGWPLGEIR